MPDQVEIFTRAKREELQKDWEHYLAEVRKQDPNADATQVFNMWMMWNLSAIHVTLELMMKRESEK